MTDAASGQRTLLSGWGRTAPSAAEVAMPCSDADVADGLGGAGRRGVIARGLGRSYGDAAQNAGGRVLDCSGLDGVFELDAEAGRLTVSAGASIDSLVRRLVPLGWFLPVTPGTRFVTVAGAIASDVHGKNHHLEGSFCQHVERFALHTLRGERIEVTPAGHPDLFHATAGGMGLTGVITKATIRLLPIETSLISVDTERAGDIDDLMARMERDDDRYRYSVAWIDLMASGRALGRGVLTRGDHARLHSLPPAHRADPLAYRPRQRLAAPPLLPGGLVNRLSVRAFNEAWFRRAPGERRGERQSIDSFFYPLDAVRHWNRLYGRDGLLQWQCVIPFGAEDILRSIVERFASGVAAPALAVLKRFGPGSGGHLSFPMPGWTLAVDLPAAGGELAGWLDALDDAVADAGGRIYLAKDARMRAALVPRMYPRLAEWRAVCDRLDPQRRLQSDLSRRLGLRG